MILETYSLPQFMLSFIIWDDLFLISSVNLWNSSYHSVAGSNTLIDPCLVLLCIFGRKSPGGLAKIS